MQYTVVDAHGATATAPVQVTVAEDVPLRGPDRARRQVQASDVKGSALRST